MVTDVSRGDSTTTSYTDPGGGPGPVWLWDRCFLFASRHLIVVCTQTCIFRCFIVFEAVVCRLYEMLYPCICNVGIACWKSGAYGYVICRGGTDMCFVAESGWKHLDLEQYHISGLTSTTMDASRMNREQSTLDHGSMIS